MTREECIELVSRPGKFEQEQPYVPYYWEVFLNGCEDRHGKDDGSVGFLVLKEDRALFPELLPGKNIVWLIETDDGFVCEV